MRAKRSKTILAKSLPFRGLPQIVAGFARPADPVSNTATTATACKIATCENRSTPAEKQNSRTLERHARSARPRAKQKCKTTARDSRRDHPAVPLSSSTPSHDSTGFYEGDSRSPKTQCYLSSRLKRRGAELARQEPRPPIDHYSSTSKIASISTAQPAGSDGAAERAAGRHAGVRAKHVAHHFAVPVDHGRMLGELRASTAPGPSSSPAGGSGRGCRNAAAAWRA